MKTNLRIRERFLALLLGAAFCVMAAPAATAADLILEQVRAAYEAMITRETARREAKEELARRMGLFEAIARNDKRRLRAMLNEGASPDSELPFPAPASFKKRYGDSDLGYYINCEPGFTVLMLATMLGQADTVDILLAAGANPWKTTKRDKTFALWMAGRAQNVDIMRSLMKITPDKEASRFRIMVNLSAQTATVWQNDRPGMVIPISSGRQGKETPTGKYLVTNKYTDWKSTKYHARMPYFLRLSCGDFGLHAGVVPGYPASHGCVRLPPEKAKELFAIVPVGALVEIK